MANFTLTCCSTVDLPKSFFDEHEIPFACFHWNDGGVDHLDDLYTSITPAEFYANIENGATPTTSQVSVGEFLSLWEPLIAAGENVLHVSLSSGISGACGAAELAADQIRHDYPGCRIVVVDSLGASSGYGMLVEYLCELRDEGKTIDEAYAWALENRLNVHHWFFSTDLTSYVRGGRVSRVSGFFGNALKICPVLNVSNEGKLIPRDKIRTKPKAVKTVVERMEQHAQNGHDYDGKCMISMSACREDAEAVRDLVEERFPKLKGKVRINDIGTVIGSHTGPGTVALFFMGDKRVD